MIKEKIPIHSVDGLVYSVVYAENDQDSEGSCKKCIFGSSQDHFPPFENSRNGLVGCGYVKARLSHGRVCREHLEIVDKILPVMKHINLSDHRGPFTECFPCYNVPKATLSYTRKYIIVEAVPLREQLNLF